MFQKFSMYSQILQRIEQVDWDKYSGPDYYDPDSLIEALVDLYYYDESNAAHGLDNKVLFAVGNNHAGTYYPAILEAVELLIEMEQKSENSETRNCARSILIDLTSFEPELGTYSTHSYDQIESYVRTKLARYTDET